MLDQAYRACFGLPGSSLSRAQRAGRARQATYPSSARQATSSRRMVKDGGWVEAACSGHRPRSPSHGRCTSSGRWSRSACPRADAPPSAPSPTRPRAPSLPGGPWKPDAPPAWRRRRPVPSRREREAHGVVLVQGLTRVARPDLPLHRVHHVLPCGLARQAADYSDDRGHPARVKVGPPAPRGRRHSGSPLPRARGPGRLGRRARSRPNGVPAFVGPGTVAPSTICAPTPRVMASACPLGCRRPAVWRVKPDREDGHMAHGRRRGSAWDRRVPPRRPCRPARGGPSATSRSGA